MIREHAFNTRWWGAPAGIVDDPAFFSQPLPVCRQSLARFEWVEFRAPFDQTLPWGSLAELGFVHTDVQITFRMNLRSLKPSPSLDALTIQRASDVAFTVARGEPAPFEHERFLTLPGATATRVDERYAMWSAVLIQEMPDLCLRVLMRDAVQGWFLPRRLPEHAGLNLALAMLHRDATISGLHLYHAALLAYSRLGERVGWATFSVGNTAVHNIYASLGARFTRPISCWLWHRRGSGPEPPLGGV